MADNNVFVTSQSKGGNIKGKKNSQGTDQKLLIFPNKLGEFYPDEPVAYMMIQIYDRKSARKLRGDQNFAISVQIDGTSTSSVGTRETNTVGAGFGKISGSENDPLVQEKLKDIGAKTGDSIVIDKDIFSLDRVIAIPMPNQVQHSLSASINQKSSSALGAAFEDPGGAAAKAAQSLITDILAAESRNGLGGKSKKTSKKLANKTLDRLDGQGQAAIDELARNNGLVANDRREMWFEGMEFRNFSFSYTFSPRNKAEAEILQNIIETLRFYMLPTYDTGSFVGGKFYLIQPAEFEMKFMIGDRENNAIPKIDRCLLKSCNVDYSPRNKWVMLSDGSGFPPEINLELQFIEKQLMFREKVFNENNNAAFGGF